MWFRDWVRPIVAHDLVETGGRLVFQPRYEYPNLEQLTESSLPSSGEIIYFKPTYVLSELPYELRGIDAGQGYRVLHASGGAMQLIERRHINPHRLLTRHYEYFGRRLSPP